MRVAQRHLMPMLVALLFVSPLAWIVFFRSDVLSYWAFRLDPAIVASAHEGTLIMSVAWHRPECELKIQVVAKSVDGKKSFLVEGPHIARMQGAERVLVDKPRKIQFPAMPPGDYDLIFDKVEGKCWFWESAFPIHNTPPKPFRFTVQ